MSALRELYESYTAASARSLVETAPPPNKPAEGMDSARFYKLVKDGNLLNKSFRYNDVDLVFTKYKLAGQRRMDYKGFKAALGDIAVKRGVTLDQLTRSLIENSAGPTISGTEALPNRFHDDKSTFTGVYKEGGPTNVDREKMTMSDLCDRFKKATVRGTPLHVVMGPGILNQSEGVLTPGDAARLSFTMDDGAEGGQDGGGAEGTPGRRRGSGRASFSASDGGGVTIPVDLNEPLRRVFETYQVASTKSADLGSHLLPPPPNPVAEGLDSARFFKLCKDANLYNRMFRTNDVDILFTKHKINVRERKMNWRGFKAALADVALKRGEALDAVVQRVIDATANGPSINGTMAEANRFHDDKSTFTGVYKEGGPTIIDREKVTMSALCDRFKKATVRGTPLHAMKGPGRHQNTPGDIAANGGYGYGDMPTPPAYSYDSLGGAGGAEIVPLKENTIVGGERTKDDDVLRDQDARDWIRAVYEEYSNLSRGFASSKGGSTPATPVGTQGQEDGIDSSRFLKLCNEAALFGKLFRTNDVDIVFTRNKREGGRKLSYEGFEMALLEVAVKKSVSFMEVVDQVVFASQLANGSHFGSGTVAEASRFYDDRRTWTGAAASASEGGAGASAATPPPPPASFTLSPNMLTTQDLVVPDHQKENLRKVFEEYAQLSRALKRELLAVNSSSSGSGSRAVGPDDGIDSSRFLKLCNDAELFDGSAFRLQDIDIIFTRCKSRDSRKLSYEGFCQALVEVCRKKSKPMRDLLDVIIFATAGGGPHINGTR